MEGASLNKVVAVGSNFYLPLTKRADLEHLRHTLATYKHIFTLRVDGTDGWSMTLSFQSNQNAQKIFKVKNIMGIGELLQRKSSRRADSCRFAGLIDKSLKGRGYLKLCDILVVIVRYSNYDVIIRSTKNSTDFGYSIKFTNSFFKTWRPARSRRRETRASAQQLQNNLDLNTYIELHITIERKAYNVMELYEGGWKKHLISAIAVANSYFNTFRITALIAHVDIWNATPPINLSYNHANATKSDLEQFLSDYCIYRRENILPVIPHDAGAIIADYRSLNSSNLGKAFISRMCSKSLSCLIIRSSDPRAMGQVLVHELGHLLGLNHEEQQISLMYKYHEECDCGKRHTCNSNCCDPDTCKLYTNASCAAGECCNLTTCQLKPACTLCRERRHEDCDIEEYCSGETNAYGHCGWRYQAFGYPRYHYKKCNTLTDAYCGLLHCDSEHSRKKLTLIQTHSLVGKNRAVLESSEICYTVQYNTEMSDKDPGQVPTGASCGSNRDYMCEKGECKKVKTKKSCERCFAKEYICNQFADCVEVPDALCMPVYDLLRKKSELFVFSLLTAHVMRHKEFNFDKKSHDANMNNESELSLKSSPSKSLMITEFIFLNSGEEESCDRSTTDVLRVICIIDNVRREAFSCSGAGSSQCQPISD
ncbi:disintegrin and metalloproteinase domain-containing protein adm-2-like [Watersipora subatra]|uniref:disintegrin and metalloproteinase domain-containing protein adm-2-like n=1 Tax=Watersipora subatra TaxID=2589382 RepID=UPI00355AF0FF